MSERIDSGDGFPWRLTGVVHLPPLPGAPRAGGGFERVYRAALADGRALAAGGFDALIVENYGDLPFHPGRAEPHTLAALALAAVRLREETGLPVGINCLRNDGVGAMGAAAAAGAAFIRVNVYTGAALTDQGLIQGCAAQVTRYRQALGVEVKIAADVLVKHARPLGESDPVRVAADTVHRGLADALILTGPATGAKADPAVLAQVRAALPRVPLLVGSGVEAADASRVLEVADGVIVGTWLKQGGRTGAPVDPRRVAEFVSRADSPTR